LLATIVLGNTLANAGIVALAMTPVLQGKWSLAYTLLGIAVMILFLCEDLPKPLAVRGPDRWAMRVARPILWLETGTGSIQRFFQRVNETILAWVVPKSVKPQNALTDQDYQELLEMAYQQGALAQ